MVTKKCFEQFFSYMVSYLHNMPHIRGGCFLPHRQFSSKDPNNFSSCLHLFNIALLDHAYMMCIARIQSIDWMLVFWCFLPVDRSWPGSWPSFLRQLRLRRARQAQPHVWTYVSKSFMLLCISYGSTKFWVVSKEPILCMLPLLVAHNPAPQYLAKP